MKFLRPHLFRRMPWRSSAVSLIVIALTGCAAQTAYREGQALWSEGHPREALLRLEEASRLDPDSAQYRLRYLQLKDRYVQTVLQTADTARDQQQWEDAERTYREILALPGQQQVALDRLRRLDQSRRWWDLQLAVETAFAKQDWEGARERTRRLQMEAPQWPGLAKLQQQLDQQARKVPEANGLSNAYSQPISLEFRDVPLRTIFEVISRSSGLNFVFDKDIRGEQRGSIYVRNATVESALAWLLRTNQLEQRVLDGNSLLIYPSSAAKTAEYQPLVVKSFYLANADVKTVANTLKVLLKTKDVVVDEKLNMLIMRDSSEAIRMAEKIVALHDVQEAEVMLEVEVLEVSRSRLLDLGVAWPSQASLTLLPSGTGSSLTLADLKNPNRRNVGVTVGAATINAKKQDSDSNLLANPRIRVRNREKAKILIGDKVPNITTNWSSTGFAGESINYVDVGLKLEVEPTIYLDSEVAIKLALEVSSVTGQQSTKSGSIAYQIGTRNAQTVLRLKDGENQVLAGLINADDRSSANKVPGLGELPIIGRLFGAQSDNATKTEIVLSITPRILRNVRRPDADILEFDSGTETSLRSWPTGVSKANSPSVGVSVASKNLGGATPEVGIDSESSGATASLPRDQTKAPPPKGVQLSWGAPPQVRLGEVFTVQLQMQSAEAVEKLPLTLAFDPDALQLVAVVSGNLTTVPGGFERQVHSNGQILVTAKPSKPPTGEATGVLTELTLRALPGTKATSLQLKVLQATATGAGGKPLEVQATLPLAIGLNRQP